MGAAPSLPTHLDTAMFEQASAVLERAQPTRREDLLFTALGVLVWGALGLTAVYLVFRFRRGAPTAVTVWIPRAIALLYVFIIPVLLLNWRLVKKLWRAARSGRALEPSVKGRLTQLFKARQRRRRLLNLATLALSALGTVVGVVALAGLVSEVLPDGVPANAPRLTLWAVAAVFGMSCVFTDFIARGRERLAAFAELRASLLTNRTDRNESQLTPQQYDEITRIERGQIAADRRRSVRAASTESLDEMFSMKEHRAFRDAKLVLAPDVLVKVQACLNGLLDRAHQEGQRLQAGDGPSYVRVPDTQLEVGFSIDWKAREVRVLSLGPSADDRRLSANDGGGLRNDQP